MNTEMIIGESALILLADDDRLVLSTMSSGLEDAGFRVIRAENGKDALDLCIEKKPDLAILDINMPQMSGMKVAEYLTEKTSVPFMFLTAYNGEEFVTAAKDMGAIGFLLKPMVVEQVVPEIKVALGRALELKESRASEDKLRKALHTVQDINIAVGIVMERYHVNSDQAFNKIRSVARSERRKLVDVACDITEAVSLLNQFNLK